MQHSFQADCRATLIGSLPLENHTEACRLVLAYTPDIPVWPQLPRYKEEGMIRQFLPGLPGVVFDNDKLYIDSDSADYQEGLIEFYEEFMAVTEGGLPLDDSRFTLSPQTARGLFCLIEQLRASSKQPIAVKGQITGPFTFCTALCDRNGRAIFYDEQLRDAAIKLLSLKARWQVQQLSAFKRPVIIFFDEPALAGFGSSEFISIAPVEIKNCLAEVYTAVQDEGALAGVHVCANTDWSLILDSAVDIVNFDAYAYFDRFILYPRQIKAFFNAGKTLAWGLVPTLNSEFIEKETVESLVSAWSRKVDQIEALGIERKTILAQSLITPSCGAGSLSIPLSQKVLELTRAVSESLRRDL